MRPLILALAMLATVAPIRQSAVAYDIIGVGIWSCEAWMEARKTKQSDVTEQWALGFMSGAAFATQDKTAPMRGQPPQVLAKWLDRYCRSHPTEVLAHATETFVTEIGH